MMRRKRAPLVLPPAILLLALGAACLPSPDEPIDYVRRENAVIIQLKNVQELSNPSDVSLRMMDRLTVPAFTLYGDGTLLFTQVDDTGQEQLIAARLPEEAILDLVQFIVDEGFLEFTYEQPEPEVVGAPLTTFLYVNTKDGTNATRAQDLSAGSLDGAGSDYTEFRRLIKIKERLESLDPVALGGTVESEYEPEALLLVVVPFTGSSPPSSPAAWIYPEIDLDEIAPPGAEFGERIITHDEVPDLFADLFFCELQIISQVFQFGEQLFVVGVRPALPFEENFPEFDQP